MEASGLHPLSYPLEIAWVCLEGNKSDSFLINPESACDWSYWCSNAEYALHKITRKEVILSGLHIKEAARRLNSALEGRTALTDAVGHDEFWLDQLFFEAAVEPTFTLLDVRDYLGAKDLGFDAYDCFLEELRKTETKHRALSDSIKIRDAVKVALKGN